MKKILLFLACAAIFAGCENKEKYPDNFTNDTPFGLKFYMSEKEASNILDSLVSINALKLPYPGSSKYEYDLKVADNGIITLSVEPRFHNDSLYYIDIREGWVRNGKSEKENYKNGISFFKTQKINLNAFSEKYEKISKKHEWCRPECKITFYPDETYLIIFSDNFISDRLMNKYLEENRQKHINNVGRVKVQNSSWDGSVRQVKDYLKVTLKDPESYEGIEWSEVKRTSDGYVVRHKYRAKNSFGGYVIENHIFYLDISGNVINVE